MAKERKSPQEKKHDEHTKDHFTFGWVSSRMFPRTWKRKKARANREYRRKSEQLLAGAKSGIAADELELLAEDLTAGHFNKSVMRERWRKTGTTTVGERVKRKLEISKERFGRRAARRQRCDRIAKLTVHTLMSLDGEQLVDVVRRAALLCGQRNASELKRVLRSNNSIDRALHFLYLLSSGSYFEIDALRRNPELDNALGAWVQKANRILKRDQRAAKRRIAQQQAARKRLKEWRSRD